MHIITFKIFLKETGKKNQVEVWYGKGGLCRLAEKPAKSNINQSYAFVVCITLFFIAPCERLPIIGATFCEKRVRA